MGADQCSQRGCLPFRAWGRRDADHVVSAGLNGIPLPTGRALQPSSTVAALCCALVKVEDRSGLLACPTPFFDLGPAALPGRVRQAFRE